MTNVNSNNFISKHTNDGPHITRKCSGIMAEYVVPTDDLVSKKNSKLLFADRLRMPCLSWDDVTFKTDTVACVEQTPKKENCLVKYIISRA